MEATAITRATNTGPLRETISPEKKEKREKEKAAPQVKKVKKAIGKATGQAKAKAKAKSKAKAKAKAKALSKGAVQELGTVSREEKTRRDQQAANDDVDGFV